MVIRIQWWQGPEGQEQLRDSDLPVPLMDSLLGEGRMMGQRSRRSQGHGKVRSFRKVHREESQNRVGLSLFSVAIDGPADCICLCPGTGENSGTFWAK